MISLPHQKYLIGQCSVNCHDMTISKDENVVTLPAKVFEFLKLLILHANQTVTKDVAIEQVWLGNVEVGKRGTGNAIWQLRKTVSELGEEPEHYFKTITKIGYQLLLTPEAIDEESYQPAAVTVDSYPPRAHAIFKPVIALLSLMLFTSLGYMFHSFYLPSSQLEALTVERITNFEGVEEQAAISPDGRFMAFQWRRELKKAQIYIKDLTDKSAPLRQVSMSEDKETSPTWSPDGQALAYFRFNASGQCELHVRELITNQDRLIDTGCTSSGYVHSLDWSPDGKFLAYAKAGEASVAIYAYSFASSEISQLTYPNTGEEDLLVSWSANSDEFAVVRSVAMDASIIVLSRSNDSVVKVVEGETMVISLEWEHDANMLYFNALRDGAFVIEQYSFESQSITDFHRDDTISSLAINEKNNRLYYSRHLSQEHITVHSLTNGQVKHRLASSSRDMFGQFIASSQEVLFLSNRSGGWELWVNQDAGSKQLTQQMGIVGIPAASPIGSQYVLPIKAKDADSYSLYLGDVATESLAKIRGIKGDVRNPSFSNNGSKIYYSSNLEGHWGVYAYDLNSQRVEFMFGQAAKYAVEDDVGGLYYTRDNQAGIYYHANDGSEDIQVTSELSSSDWGSFFYQNNALYFIKRTDTNDQVIAITADGQQHTVFSLPAVSIRGQRALAKADDESVVISMLGINDADIYSVSLAARH